MTNYGTRIGASNTRRYGRLIEKCIEENQADFKDCTIICSQSLKKQFEENRSYFNYTSLFEIPIKTTTNRGYVALRVQNSKSKTTYILVDNGIIQETISKEEFLKLSDDEKWELFLQRRFEK